MRKKEQIDHAAETIADLFECNYEHHLGKYVLQILGAGCLKKVGSRAKLRGTLLHA